MKSPRGLYALIGVLLFVCAAVAWEWYTHVSGNRAAPRPVQQLPAPSPSAVPMSPGKQTPPLPLASAAAGNAGPSPGPVTYVPVASSASPAPPTSAPYATGSPPVEQVPVELATVAPHVTNVEPMAEPADAPPRILSMSISTPVARGGQLVSGTVQTSSNVASVEARIAGYSSSMRKVGAGKFAMTYRVPYLPFFLHRTYQIEVIARNTRGVAVRTAVPITIR